MKKSKQPRHSGLLSFTFPLSTLTIGVATGQPFDLKGSIKGCQQQWGVTPRPMWATVAWGGKRIDTASNIVFTNGLLDPWCASLLF